MMVHKFDVNNRKKLDNLQRREILHPEQILSLTELKQRDTIADIGCGTGYFSLPAAEIVGSEGQIFALDVRPEMIADVEQKAQKSGISNITTVLTEEYDFKVEDRAVSVAFISLVLHEIEDEIRFLSEAKRILKDNGKIVIVEWIRKEGQWGPPADERLEEAEVKKKLQDTGFKDIAIIHFNAEFYIVTARKA